MFFLLRSAACIGVVFCMLPDAGGSKALHELASAGGRLAVGQAERYCTADPECLRTGAKLAAAALTEPSAPTAQSRGSPVVVSSKIAGAGSSKARPQSKG